MSAESVNLGSDRRPFMVEFAVNPIFDLLVGLWSCEDGDPKLATYEIGEQWFHEFRGAIPPEVLSDLDNVGGRDLHQITWMLMGLAAERLAGARDPEDVLEWISTHAYEAILSEMVWHVSPELVDLVLAGDDEARERFQDGFAKQWNEKTGETDKHSVSEFLDADPTHFSRTMASDLRQVRETAFAAYEQDWVPALERSAASVALTVPGSQPHELIERITNGIDFQLPLGITRIVLVPSVLVRPWSVVSEVGSSIVVVYPVSEEHLNADPDAAPSWLVAFYKALGDDKRMKILRRLGTGPADLSELTEMLGMAKSSTFHHIGVLRSAGLIRVHIGGADDRTYGLRKQAFGDAEGLLDKYLETPLLEQGDIS